MELNPITAAHCDLDSNSFDNMRDDVSSEHLLSTVHLLSIHVFISIM